MVVTSLWGGGTCVHVDAQHCCYEDDVLTGLLQFVTTFALRAQMGYQEGLHCLQCVKKLQTHITINNTA